MGMTADYSERADPFLEGECQRSWNEDGGKMPPFLDRVAARSFQTSAKVLEQWQSTMMAAMRLIRETRGFI